MKLPSSVETERLVLGSILLNDLAFSQVAGIIEPEDWILENHRRIFSSMLALIERGERIDRVTIFNELKNRGQAESVGGLSYLVSLDEGLPEIANLESYIRIVKEKATRRKLIFAARKLALLAQDETESIEDTASSVVAMITDVAAGGKSNLTPISTGEMIAAEGLDNLLGARQMGAINLPLRKLNQELRGMHGGQMAVLMAKTSRGKSSLAYQIATAAAMQGFAPVIWTLEVSPRDAFQCIAQQISGVWPGKEWLTLKEREDLNMAGFQLNEHWIYFDAHSRNVQSFVAALRRVRQKDKLGLAIVDHLQLIRSGANRNRAQEVSENSRALKLASMDLDIPFFVLSQVDRSSVKGEGKIGLHSAKESGDIENDADVVMWIEAEEEFSWDDDSRASLHIGKQRAGRAGFKIPMIFRPSHRVFLEVAE